MQRRRSLLGERREWLLLASPRRQHRRRRLRRLFRSRSFRRRGQILWYVCCMISCNWVSTGGSKNYIVIPSHAFSCRLRRQICNAMYPIKQRTIRTNMRRRNEGKSSNECCSKGELVESNHGLSNDNAVVCLVVGWLKNYDFLKRWTCGCEQARKKEKRSAQRYWS